jgi:GTP 3',8-cyclase
MFDSYNRRINYLRISVTDRCNLRCTYCMPEEGIKLINREDILRFEEIIEVVRVAVSMGINKVRLTGGEPLVRGGVTDLVAMLSSVPGIEDLALTTNGILLKDHALSLKTSGLHRVNVSLDTFDPETYKRVTRGGDMNRVLEGIFAAREVGLNPVKLNCVVERSSQEKDALLVKEFAEREKLRVRFIRRMDLPSGDFSIVEGGEGGNCSKCNRLRLTANGMVKPCLFGEQEFSVRELGAQQALKSAIDNKPKQGCTNRTGTFYRIGG